MTSRESFPPIPNIWEYREIIIISITTQILRISFPVRLCSATNTSSSPLKSTKLMRQQHLFYSSNTQLCPLALSNRQPPTENSSMAMEALLNAAASSPSRPPLSKKLLSAKLSPRFSPQENIPLKDQKNSPWFFFFPL